MYLGYANTTLHTTHFQNIGRHKFKINTNLSLYSAMVSSLCIDTRLCPRDQAKSSLITWNKEIVTSHFRRDSRVQGGIYRRSCDLSRSGKQRVTIKKYMLRRNRPHISDCQGFCAPDCHRYSRSRQQVPKRLGVLGNRV